MPSQALADSVSMDGDVVEIQGGNYVDCSFIKRNNITIRGTQPGGVRPHMHGKVCGGKGIFVVTGHNILIDNLELSDVSDPGTADRNWAGVRIEAGMGNDIIIRNSYFHDSDNGILGATIDTGTLVVENSKFEHLGRVGYAHGMYISPVGKFVLRNSVVLSNHDDGHLVKTRALSSLIECNLIAGLDGFNSYAVDMPQGGDNMLRNNVIQNGPNASNRNAFVNFAEENRDNPIQSLTLQNNVLINDKPMAAFIWDVGTPTFNNWAGNIFIGPGVPFNGNAPSAGFTQTTRAAVGLPSYNGSLTSLPAAPFCN